VRALVTAPCDIILSDDTTAEPARPECFITVAPSCWPDLESTHIN